MCILLYRPYITICDCTFFNIKFAKLIAHIIYLQQNHATFHYQP